MTADEVLTTTRSVRKRLDFDRPVPREVIEECLEIAVQAPSGSNRQTWSFLVLTDPEPKRVVAEAYRKAFHVYATQIFPSMASFPPEDPRTRQAPAMTESAMYLAQRMHEVPVMVIPCIEGKLDRATLLEAAGQWGSIAPATWSFMLALRARGLGSTWTILHLMFEQEVSRALGIPEGVSQTALLPVAYTKGTDFKKAGRIPASQLTSWNCWGQR
ncbi:MAG: putative oxidoreductase [Candidatus Xenobia bacterium]|jgi:nitroreductase